MEPRGSGQVDEGRLRIARDTLGVAVRPGLQALGLDRERDALLYAPRGYQPGRPVPLVVSLHGAGGNERAGLLPLQDLADACGFFLLSPASRSRTWDLLLGGFGPDVAFLGQALSLVLASVAVDREDMAISGFSDGASFALSLGITNGDLFPEVIAFSPGFADPGPPHGRPRFFVSHGTNDRVLGIDRTSRRVVPRLRDAGYDVTYREFNGPHLVPPAIARDAMEWWLDDGASARSSSSG